jgi:hypothetical protein
MAGADSDNVQGCDKDSGLHPFDHGGMFGDVHFDAENGETSDIIPYNLLAMKTNP